MCKLGAFSGHYFVDGNNIAKVSYSFNDDSVGNIAFYYARAQLICFDASRKRYYNTKYGITHALGEKATSLVIENLLEIGREYYKTIAKLANIRLKE